MAHASRLLWGVAGQSNALAVAQGLGFSPDVLREARVIAENMRAVTDLQPRNETLAASLEEQLRESQARIPGWNERWIINVSVAVHCYTCKNSQLDVSPLPTLGAYQWSGGAVQTGVGALANYSWATGVSFCA